VSAEKYLNYRGDVKAVAAVGGVLAFVTTHLEGQPTALYRLDADTLALDAALLPRGGVALASDGETVWAAGGEGQLYEARAGGGKPKPLGSPLAAAPAALAPLADGRLAAVVGAEVVIVSRKDGKPLQTLELPDAENGRCLAVDPSGRWLAVGTVRGTVAVFDAEDKPGFLLSASARLHEGAVTVLLFESDELRFFSAGADHKLLSTHARGRLEPEDKGRGNNHADLVTALVWGPGDRLYSGSRDGTIKSWPRVGAVKPATVKDGVGKVVALAIVTVHDRPRLAAACDDNTVRFFGVDAAGKIGELSQRVHDAYDRAKADLAQDESRLREAALKELAGFGDARSLELISEQVGRDADHAVRRQAVELLGASDHPRAPTLLTGWLGHADAAVRVAAFSGLRRQLGADDLRPLDQALKVEQADVGKLAVEALGALVKRNDQVLGRIADAIRRRASGAAPGRNDQALARLVSALDARTPEVRQAALPALEGAYDADSPEADLLGLGSKHADVRRVALVRLFRRELLRDPAVQSALRRRAEDPDDEVRRTAFLLSLRTREALVATLRARDPDLHRQLAELEGAPAAEGDKGKAPPKKGKAGPALTDDDLEPLLQATASRALRTCLRGAYGLAVLGDPRALGLLLQLSREGEGWARAEVCRALAALDDPRAVERLRSLLHDKDAAVRDAAFSALARLYQSDPLRAAEAGLNASAEDVRRRALQVLIAEVRKAPPRGPGEPAPALLERALNDGSPSVRSEALKAALNLQVAGGGPKTLRFALRSIHADVRREVLTEVTAQVGEPWGWDLLLEFFNDPDPALRDEVFGFAVKKTKGLEFLEAGLGSRYPDVRKKSVEALVKKHTPAAQALLARSLGDEERAIRLAALESLVAADARPELQRALERPHADVRLRAAKALARHGHPSALEPLRALAAAPEPPEKERVSDWVALAESALDGLGELGDPAALPVIIPALDSPHAALRKQAARALDWVARDETLGALRQALQHADPQVRFPAALGLAFAGDVAVAPLVFSDAAGAVLSEGDRLVACLTLGPAGEDRLVVFLDDEKEAARDRALMLLLFKEWKDPQGTTARALAALSCRLPRMRLTAARALESLAEPAAFPDFVVRQVNDRGDKPAWQVPAAVVDDLAELLTHAPGLLKARTARLLKHLRAEEQAAWDLAWSAHAGRFAAEVARLRREAKDRPKPAAKYGPMELRELAFGGYVGLVREQGGSSGKEKEKGKPAAADPGIVRVRQTALGRLMEMARADAHFARAARPVFVQALGDPNQAVRFQAFDQLRALDMAPTALAAEALATGHTDLGVKGLELLTGGASDAEAQAVLERAMVTRTDDLATEAAKLLIARRGAVPVAARALEASHEPLRQQAVAWLAAAFEADPAAREALRQALGSRYARLREAAALELAVKKDAAAFEALVGLLREAQLPLPQQRYVQALQALGDPRTPGALLDRLEDDPGGTARADVLLKAVGSFRRPEVADRLLALLAARPKERKDLFAALLAVSGFDQRVEDPDDERPDRSWEEKQHPRRVDVLAKLMDRCAALGDAELLRRLIPAARWARDGAVDAPLSALVHHPDERLRRDAVEALGWRLRQRSGPADPLIKALQHGDPITQFFAAEGLAKGGRAEGLNVLLAGVEFLNVVEYRRRAVLALGELADPRALDTLLRFANEAGHALQEPAAEAVGHLGRSEKAGEVLALLDRLSRGTGSAAAGALRGLRWLGTRDAWRLVRERAADPGAPNRALSVNLLSFDDEPATRDLLLRLLRDDEDDAAVGFAMGSARRLWGDESLEPDYAILRNTSVSYDDEEAVMKRVAERGEPGRLFEIVPRCGPEVREALTFSLLGRSPLPVAEAAAVLGGNDARAVALAAHVLGRAGTASGAGVGRAVEAALARWRSEWDALRDKHPPNDQDEQRLADELSPCLRMLTWAAGRLGVAPKALAALAAARPGDPAFQPVRREAVAALAEVPPDPDSDRALEAAALGGDPDVRALSSQAVAGHAPGAARALAGRLLSDRVSFDRLARHGAPPPDDTLRDAARQVHYQGVALPYLIERGDVAGLGALAADRSLSESARLGAVEGLAALGLEAAEDALRRIGADGADDEELRKASWRGLRRSQRLRHKRAGVKS
jgi:ParB family chromosome partitioning protein